MISSVTALTQTQLESYNDNAIRNFLNSNAVKQNTYFDQPTNNYIFSYKLKTISKQDNKYIFTEKMIYASLSRDTWTLCRYKLIENGYTDINSYNTCLNLLVNSNNDYSMISKLKKQRDKEIIKIAKWRDNPTINENIIMGDLI